MKATLKHPGANNSWYNEYIGIAAANFPVKDFGSKLVNLRNKEDPETLAYGVHPGMSDSTYPRNLKTKSNNKKGRLPRHVPVMITYDK